MFTKNHKGLQRHMQFPIKNDEILTKIIISESRAPTKMTLFF